jgi:hypothetical protein
MVGVDAVSMDATTFADVVECETLGDRSYEQFV